MIAQMTPVEVLDDALVAPYSDVQPVSLTDIERVEGQMLQWPQVDIPLRHEFAPHVYWREVFMPAGTFVLGQQHKTEHFNVILTGEALVMMDGKMHRIIAPDVLVSKGGVRKILYIVSDMRWATVHPTDTTDLDVLEDELIIKSDTFLRHEEMLMFRDYTQKLLEDDK